MKLLLFYTFLYITRSLWLNTRTIIKNIRLQNQNQNQNVTQIEIKKIFNELRLPHSLFRNFNDLDDNMKLFILNV